MKKILFIVVFFSFSISFSQVKEKTVYDVINSIFKDKENNSYSLYKNFYNNKGWSVTLINSSIFDNLYGNCLCEEKKELLSINDIITKDEYQSIIESISNFAAHQKIDKKLLNNNIKLNNSPKSIKITKPIIINDKAILYYSTNNEEKIIILLKNKTNQWELICSKYLFLRTSN